MLVGGGILTTLMNGRNPASCLPLFMQGLVFMQLLDGCENLS